MDLMFIADPLDALDPKLDTTLALIAAAHRRGHRVWHCRLHQLALRDGSPIAWAKEVGGPTGGWIDLDAVDVVLLRTDPPVDRSYLEATLILDRVDPSRTVLVNDPRGVRIVNEKLWVLQHPHLCPPTLVAADVALIHGFVDEHRSCVVKPIDGFAGRGVLRLDADDDNRTSIVEIVTERGRRPVVVQPWLEDIRCGSKRIFVHDGRPAGAVLRHPAGHDFRIGLPSEVVGLSHQDVEICAQLGPELRALGLVLVGIDVIGDHVVDVNVTSAGGLHKADRLLGTSLCDGFIELLEHRTGRSS